MNKLLKIRRSLPYYSYDRFYSTPSSNQPQNEDKNDVPKKYDPSSITKESLKWRTDWTQRESLSESLDPLRTFYDQTSHTDTLKAFQTPLNLTPSAIMKLWNHYKVFKAKAWQAYIPERNQTLGNELAAAHFIVFRGGSVKFHNSDQWIKPDDYNSLSTFYEPDKVLQAIDCSGMTLYYEGLLNIRELKNLEWVSFNQVEEVDDWFLDRISNIFRRTVAYLDIRNCPNYTERGLGSLYKMEKLEILRIDDMLMTSAFEMTCLMLQEYNPNLEIRIG